MMMSRRSGRAQQGDALNPACAAAQRGRQDFGTRHFGHRQQENGQVRRRSHISCRVIELCGAGCASWKHNDPKVRISYTMRRRRAGMV